jgi:hypothetical protein
MRNLKIVLVLVALGVAGLIIYQNMAYLLTSTTLQLDLWFAGPYSVGIINGQVILGALFAGLLVSYFSGLSSRFKNSKLIKELNSTLTTQTETITALKSELSKYQAPTPQQEPPQPGVPVENT